MTTPVTADKSKDLDYRPTVEALQISDVQQALSKALANRFGPEFVAALPSARAWPKGRGV